MVVATVVIEKDRRKTKIQNFGQQNIVNKNCERVSLLRTKLKLEREKKVPKKLSHDRRSKMKIESSFLFFFCSLLSLANKKILSGKMREIEYIQ